MRRLALAASLVLGGCSCDGETLHTSIVPDEVADEEALASMTDWMALPRFGAGRYAQQSSEDRKTGAPVEIPLWDHGNRDFNSFVCRGARADAPPIKVAHVLDVPECVEPHVEGLVMARFEGSGRLSRIWLTAASMRRRPPDDEVMRIYVDDEPAARIEVLLADMLGGGAHEIFAPPFGAGSSRYLAWYYPLVFSEKLIVSIDRLGSDDLYFHQTDVVLDETPRPRRAAPTRLPARDDARDLLSSSVPLAGTPHSFAVSLQGGEERAIDIRGPRTIVKARLRIARERLADLGRVRLVVAWDDKPAMDLPLSDLFAAWREPVERSGPALAARDLGSDIELTLALPMPFAETAEWKLGVAAGEPVAFELVFELTEGVPSGRWGRLHVERHETLGNAKEPTHLIARAEGTGRLVGVCADLHGHGLLERGEPGHPFHFLEGDEALSIDGSRAAGGTGTEDYFNGAFYFEDGAAATPFAQVWDITPHLRDAPAQGRVSACRWHVLGDAIDFTRSLELLLEIGPGVPDVLDRFLSVAYLYR